MASPRVLLPGWDLQQLLVPEQEGQQRVLLADSDGNPIFLQNGKTHILPGQDSQKLLVAGHNYQKLVVPTTNKFSPSQPEPQVMRLVVTSDGQKLVLPAQAPRQEIQTGKNIVLQQQDAQKVIGGQTLLLTGPQDTQQVIMLGLNDKTSAIGKPLLVLADSSITSRFPQLARDGHR